MRASGAVGGTGEDVIIPSIAHDQVLNQDSLAAQPSPLHPAIIKQW